MAVRSCSHCLPGIHDRPIGAASSRKASVWVPKCSTTLSQFLRLAASTVVGDEGGFAPNLEGTEDALNVIMKAIATIGLDCASSEFFKDGIYDYTWKQADGPKYTSRLNTSRLSLKLTPSTLSRTVWPKTTGKAGRSYRLRPLPACRR